jgi:hypothetical protein
MWAKVDDAFPDHPKAVQCSLAAHGLWLYALCYACRHLTDGFVPFAVLKRATVGEDGAALIRELLAAGLWRQIDDPPGITIHDFTDYQPTRAQAEAMRADKSRAGRVGAMARWHPDASTAPVETEPMAPAMADAWHDDSKTHSKTMAEQCPVPVPVPVPEPEPVVEPETRGRRGVGNLSRQQSAPTDTSVSEAPLAAFAARDDDDEKGPFDFPDDEEDGDGEDEPYWEPSPEVRRLAADMCFAQGEFECQIGLFEETVLFGDDPPDDPDAAALKWFRDYARREPKGWQELRKRQNRHRMGINAGDAVMTA